MGVPSTIGDSLGHETSQGRIARGAVSKPDIRSSEGKISVHTITSEQFVADLIGILAFTPATICPGYLTAYWTDLYGFRSRTFPERVCWSLPLSLSISIIGSVLLSEAGSVDCAAVFFIAAALICAGVQVVEWRQVQVGGKRSQLRLSRSTVTVITLCLLWITTVLLSLVDIQRHEHLYLNMALYDQGFRIDWTASALHSGVPLLNPLYKYGHVSGLRTFYFWYALCATVARYSHLQVRPVVVAGSVWSVLNLVAIIGLYLKHFLRCGKRLRMQLVICIGLISVTGLDLCMVLWNLERHGIITGDIESWSEGQVTSWLDSFLWVPHHVVALVLCWFAFLLAWLSSKEQAPSRLLTTVLLGLALSSGFGTSIFVVFAFFLAFMVWAVWELVVRRKYQISWQALQGGALAVVLIFPYIWELLNEPSGNSSKLFSFAVRQMFPPDDVLALKFFQNLSAHHPDLSLNLANVLLLVPGYLVELGFFGLVLLIFCISALRRGGLLSPEHESLLIMALGTLLWISCIRSGVLYTNDFGWRGALILQFSLLLLGSELIVTWSSRLTKSDEPVVWSPKVPNWSRIVCVFSLGIGILGSFAQAILLRITMPALEMNASKHGESSSSHNAYISYIGYKKLTKAIPVDATIQYNPDSAVAFANVVDVANVEHQVAVFSDRAECGSVWGGISAGCPAMARDIDALFQGRATFKQARATCEKYGIQYLVARIYDPAWNLQNGWVWTLPPIVADKEFRVVDCR